MTMTRKELRVVGEKLAEMCAIYHKEVAENSGCKSDELVSQMTINDDEYIYKIVINADPLDDDRASEHFDDTD